MVSGLDIKKNLDDMRQLVAEASNKGAKLILLPEFFALLSNQQIQSIYYSEPAFEINKSNTHENCSPIQRAISDAAKKNKVWIVGGTVPLKTKKKEKIYNSMLTFNSNGILVARYDKVHLFKYQNGQEIYDESQFIVAGNEKLQMITPAGNTFFSVCYDIRFPEFFRKKTESPVLLDLILVTAAFTFQTGMAHWELLLRTRAIENQCFVLASAQGGQHECGRNTWGHSMLISPWGDIIDECATGKGIVIGDIDQKIISNVRKKLPAISHQRFDL